MLDGKKSEKCKKPAEMIGWLGERETDKCHRVEGIEHKLQPWTEMFQYSDAAPSPLSREMEQNHLRLWQLLLLFPSFRYPVI